jgi:hypothetical protein
LQFITLHSRCFSRSCDLMIFCFVVYMLLSPSTANSP